MSEELREIKKLYGEEMMHLCRELFPTILETEGRLLQILKNNLAPTHSFAQEIKYHYLEDEFKSWIYSFIDVRSNKLMTADKTPFELMDEAGYTLYECHSEEEIQSFKKYYEPREELCTFRGGRLNNCFVFFAVKKNVDEIKREDFPNPKREDVYGRSVISIQFSRGKINTLSIKNRYNHTVNNPDATYGNNLENIIPGLTNSFENNYSFRINEESSNIANFLTDDLSYVRALDGKYYRYNIEDNGMYYCENNIIIPINRGVFDFYAQSQERYIVIDKYIVDLKKKSIRNFNDKDDSFIESINSVGNIKNINVIKNGDNRLVRIIYENDRKVEIEINKNNAIVGYKNNYIREISSDFLCCNMTLSNIELESTRRIANGFLSRNKCLKRISLPQVIRIGSSFLRENQILNDVNLPKVEEINDGFLISNKELEELRLPNVQIIGDCFLAYNNALKRIYLPNVQIIKFCFLNDNIELRCLELPEVIQVQGYFMFSNKALKSLYLPKIEKIGECFLNYNESLREIELPEVNEIGKNFLQHDCNIKRVYAPKLLDRYQKNLPEGIEKSIIL